MASTTAMFTALSGMNAHARRLETIGNNIANVNTNAFKSSRTLFATQFSRTFSAGTPPAEDSGGTNPRQIGHGVLVAGTQKDFRLGSITATGDPRDLAIEGNGLFAVQRGVDTLYTRVGSFRQDAQNNLVTIDGDRVMGYTVDNQFNLQTGALAPLNIPVGTMMLAQATQNVLFAGNLNASGQVAGPGAAIRIGAGPQAGFSLVPSATVPPPPGSAIAPGSLLAELADPRQATSPLLAPGQFIELRGAERGERFIPPARFAVTAASTVQDLMAFLSLALGLNTAATNSAGPPPGVALNPATGTLEITGNAGAVNDLSIDAADLRVLDSDGQLLRTPFVPERTASAEGESVRTTFVAYDSLGAPVSIDLGLVLESRDSAGTVWRYFADSPVPQGQSSAIGTGTIRFDSMGQLEPPTAVQLQVPRTGTAAADPLPLTLDFAQGGSRLTALSSQESFVASTYQDGAPLGILAAFGVQEDGTILGSFTSGIVRTLGQIPVTSFVNPEGLIDEGGNIYRPGANSGQPVLFTPGEGGTGRLVAGALELSNVDLGQEFINMIMTSTGYSASSRIIRTSDELLQQLLLLGR
jgi:flagellar hook protein FlgE